MTLGPALDSYRALGSVSIEMLFFQLQFQPAESYSSSVVRPSFLDEICPQKAKGRSSSHMLFFVPSIYVLLYSAEKRARIEPPTLVFRSSAGVRRLVCRSCGIADLRSLHLSHWRHYQREHAVPGYGSTDVSAGETKFPTSLVFCLCFFFCVCRSVFFLCTRFCSSTVKSSTVGGGGQPLRCWQGHRGDGNDP